MEKRNIISDSSLAFIERTLIAKDKEISTLKAILEKKDEALKDADSALDCLKTFYRRSNHPASPTWKTAGIEQTISRIKEALALTPETYVKEEGKVNPIDKPNRLG